MESYGAREQPVAWPPRRTDLPITPLAARWLPTIKRRLVDQFHPERIVLFGSQVAGTAHPDSDIDLLVVLGAVADARALRIAIRVALRDIPISVDAKVTTPERVARYGTLVGTILRPALLEGVTLYARR